MILHLINKSKGRTCHFVLRKILFRWKRYIRYDAISVYDIAFVPLCCASSVFLPKTEG